MNKLIASTFLVLLFGIANILCGYSDYGSHGNLRRRNSDRRQYGYSYSKLFRHVLYARCPLRNRQEFFRRRSPGPVLPNLRLSNKRVIVQNSTTGPNFQRNTDVGIFLRIFEKENGFSRAQTLDYIRGALLFGRDFWGIDDLTNQNLSDVLNENGILVLDGKVRIQVTTFSSPTDDGLNAPAKLISETSNIFCRSYTNEPLSFSGVYLYILEDFTSLNGVSFKANEIIFNGNIFVPACGFYINSRTTAQSTSTEDPKNPGIFLASTDLEAFTSHDGLGWGTGKLVRTFDANKGQLIGYTIYTWDEDLSKY